MLQAALTNLPALATLALLAASRAAGPLPANSVGTVVVDPAAAHAGSLRSLPEALRRARSSNGSVSTILLRGGTHRLPGAAGFVLTAEDGGTAVVPTIIAAFPGERPRLSAGYDVPHFAWSPVPAADPIYGLLPPASRAAVRVAQLPPTVDSGSFAPELAAPSPYLIWEANRLEVFAGGDTPLNVARWPNLVSEAHNPGGGRIAGGGRASWTRTAQNSSGKTIVLEAGAPAAGWAASRAATAAPVFFKGFFGFDFSDEVVQVTMVAASNRTVQVDHIPPYCLSLKGFREGYRFHSFNAVSDLDSPGEYWHDPRTGKLYIIPPAEQQRQQQLSVMVTNGQNVLTINRTAHIAVSGLLIEGSRRRGIHIVDSHNIAVQGCTIRNVGTAGIHAERSSNLTVSGCVTNQTGGPGVDIMYDGDEHADDGGQVLELRQSGTKIVSNTLHNFGRIFFSFRPGVSVNGTKVVIANNDIAHGPHCGILLAGNDHLVAQNAIHHVVQQASDMGAISAGCSWINRGNRIEDNLIFSIGNHESGACNSYWEQGDCSATGCKVSGRPVPMNCSAHHIYIDWTQPAFTIVGNIFWQGEPTKVASDGGLFAVFLNGGRDHTVTANMFVGNFTAAVHLSAIGLTDFMASVNASLLRDLRTVRYRRQPWADHYPRLAALDDYVATPLLGNCSTRRSCPAAPFGNSFRSNVAVNLSSVLVGRRPLWQRSDLVDGRWLLRGYDPSVILVPQEGQFSRDNIEIEHSLAVVGEGGGAAFGWVGSGEATSSALKLDPATGPCLQLKPTAQVFKDVPGFAAFPWSTVATAAFRASMGCALALE
jgi:parallel beta-helix repeat protein